MDPTPEHRDHLAQAARRKATLAQTAKAVFWAFFGVRKGADHAKDVAHLNPIHVVIMGIIAAALFVFTLVIVVNIVVSG